VSKPLYRCMTKATQAEGEGVRHSLDWVFARRGILEVRPDALVCGDWVIPYSDIEESVLYSVRQTLIPGFVLVVRARGHIYQFGLNWGRFWSRELPFPVRRERARLGHSWFSVAVRVILLGLVVYSLWRRLRGG
jgi:hypothetical protein